MRAGEQPCRKLTGGARGEWLTCHRSLLTARGCLYSADAREPESLEGQIHFFILAVHATMRVLDHLLVEVYCAGR